MTGSELFMRCVKARIVSWLNTTTVGAIVPTMEGPPIVLAVYANGRYVNPDDGPRTPDSPAEMWGPDGPIYRSQGATPPLPEPPSRPEPPAPEPPEETPEDGTDPNTFPG